MADPILGLSELLEGDSKGYLRQNDRNLVMARLAADPRVVNNSLSAPPGSVARGDAFVIAGTATGHWAGQAANTVAIAMSANPSSPSGWFFYIPKHGLRLWILAGSGTLGHVVWNGTAFVAV
jgi:hypothetical protein